MSAKFNEYKHLNLKTIHKETLEFWKENKIFEQSIAERQGKPSFIFYEGPPSANGMPGIHHVMARAIKDIFCRYKTQKGYLVNRKAGWDTHGLPIELGVEKTLGITKEDIGKTITVQQYNQACRKEVMKYTDIWNKLTEEMGYWVDMNDPYITYDNKYIESVWWLLKQIFDKGLIYKGYTIQPYSPKAGTGLSSHELNQPGCYRDVKDTSVVAFFKLNVNKENTSLFQKAFAQNLDTETGILAWTTTPWTLPSNTALTVGEKIDYVLISTFNTYTKEPQKVILARELVAKNFGKNFDEVSTEEALNQADLSNPKAKIPYLIISKCKGEDLVNLTYEQLLPYATPMADADSAFRVIPGDFVTTEDGTGIVHTAPTFGADDARVAKAAGVPPMLVADENGNPVPLVDLRGRFLDIMNDKTFGLGGEYIKEEYLTEEEKEAELKKQQSLLSEIIPKLDKYLSVDERIALKLKIEGKAFKIEKYEHSYPHCWRTDKPVLYYPLDSWFIKTTEVKEQMIANNKKIQWKPESTGTGRFGNWLENVNDWNLSRSRFWGIPLPIWRNEEGTETKCIGSVEELKVEIEKSVAAGFMSHNPLQDFKIGDLSSENYQSFDLHKPYADDIFLVSATGKPMKREADLIDVWFDSGAMPFAQYHFPFAQQRNTTQEGEILHISGQDNSKFQSEATPSPEGRAGVGPETPNQQPSSTPSTYVQERMEHDNPPLYYTADSKTYSLIKDFASENKRSMTEAESYLCEKLRNKKLGGYKFRRQHIIDSYIADFVCLSKKLVIEVEGGIHKDREVKEKDEIRETILKRLGFKVMKFQNEEVLYDIDRVLAKILNTLNELPTPPSPYGENVYEVAPPTPPQGGETLRSSHLDKIPSKATPSKISEATPSPEGRARVGLETPNQQPSSTPSPEGRAGVGPETPNQQPSSTPSPEGRVGVGLETPNQQHQSTTEKSGVGHYLLQQLPYPADFIAEGVDQTRGWFYTLHAISTLVFDSVAYKTVISNGLVLDKNGQKMSKRLGNAVDPFTTIEKYGTDAVRWYMITNAQPWDNLKFDLTGIEEVQRKFFGTLYNTYSFFALYANVDQFTHKEELIPVAQRPEIDRWILSELNTLIQEVDKAYEEYEPTRAGRAIQYFVTENLSNWYVRLCRRRFWKGDYAQDKISAYQTLFECLFSISKLMAPIAPFFADRLYQDLNKATQLEPHTSVHLAFFPESNSSLIDSELEKQTHLAQQISSMVLSLRKKEKLKVRQPLQKIMVPALNEDLALRIEKVKELVLAEVNVKELEILRDVAGRIVKKIKPDFKKLGAKLGKAMKEASQIIAGLSQEQIQDFESQENLELQLSTGIVNIGIDEVEILTDDIPGWLVITERGLTVALDITLNQELIQEGIARELINRLQNIRKESGLEVTDRITVYLSKNETLELAVGFKSDYIKAEILADKIIFDEGIQGELLDMDDIQVQARIEKV